MRRFIGLAVKKVLQRFDNLVLDALLPKMFQKTILEHEKNSAAIGLRCLCVSSYFP